MVCCFFVSTAAKIRYTVKFHFMSVYFLISCVLNFVFEFLVIFFCFAVRNTFCAPFLVVAVIIAALIKLSLQM